MVLRKGNKRTKACWLNHNKMVGWMRRTCVPSDGGELRRNSITGELRGNKNRQTKKQQQANVQVGTSACQHKCGYLISLRAEELSLPELLFGDESKVMTLLSWSR